MRSLMQRNNLISVKVNTDGSVLPCLYYVIYTKYFTSLFCCAELHAGGLELERTITSMTQALHVNSDFDHKKYCEDFSLNL